MKTNENKDSKKTQHQEQHNNTPHNTTPKHGSKACVATTRSKAKMSKKYTEEETDEARLLKATTSTAFTVMVEVS